MAQSMKDIKQRIKSVESTRQITNAMKLVATSKLRRAKERVERGRPFFTTLYDTMVDISSKNTELNSTYTIVRGVKHSCFIVIGGDRGLAGGYNSGVIKLAESMMKDKDVKLIPIGKKVFDYFSRRHADIINGNYVVVEDVKLANCFEIALEISKRYASQEFDEVFIVYTNFVSTLTQQPAAIKLLPLVNLNFSERAKSRTQIVYEPSVEQVFNNIVPQYIAGLIYGAIVESFAAEQGARRTAMEAATDNATEMIDELGLAFNRARQGAITQEISEISAGAQALS